MTQTVKTSQVSCCNKAPGAVTSDLWLKTSMWAPAAHSQHPTPRPAARREMLQRSWKQSKGCSCHHPCCQVRIEAETAQPGLRPAPSSLHLPAALDSACPQLTLPEAARS